MTQPTYMPSTPRFFLTAHVSGVGTRVMLHGPEFLSNVARYDAASGVAVSALATAFEPLRQHLLALMPAAVTGLPFGAVTFFLARPNFAEIVSAGMIADLGWLHLQAEGREVTVVAQAWVDEELCRRVAMDQRTLALAQAHDGRETVLIGLDWDTGLWTRVLDGPLTLAQAEQAYQGQRGLYTWEFQNVATAQHPSPLT